METVEIKGTLRKETGKKFSKKIRSEGEVPCVMYGGEEVIHFSAPELSFKKIVYTPNIYLLKLDINGKIYDALLQDIQFHPVTDRIIHLDFKHIFFDKEVITYLPVKLIGDSIGIKNGGKLRQKRRRLKVKALPDNLPDFLEIDITEMEIGQSVKVGELKYDNLNLLDTHRAMVVAIASSRLAKGMEIAEEEVAEGEEAVTEEVAATGDTSATETSVKESEAEKKEE